MTVILLWIAAGGALGAVARYLVSNLMMTWLGPFFPWGTLTVNILGSLAIGAGFAYLSDSPGFHSIARPFLIIGCLGAFTTFSTFSLEALALIDDGRALLAVIYAVASVVLCIGGAWIGTRLFGAG